MSFRSSDISFVLSGGDDNSDPNLSLGGDPSIHSIHASRLFSNLTSTQTSDGTIDYRAIYINNENSFDTLCSTSLFFVCNTDEKVLLGIKQTDEIQQIIVYNFSVVTSGELTLVYSDIFYDYPIVVEWSPSPEVFVINLQDALRTINYLQDVVVSYYLAGFNAIFEIKFTGSAGNRFHDLIQIQANSLYPPTAVESSRFLSGSPINSIAEEITSSTNSPNIIFTESAISLGDLRPLDSVPIWFQRIVPANSIAAKEGFLLRVSGSGTGCATGCNDGSGCASGVGHGSGSGSGSGLYYCGTPPDGLPCEITAEGDCFVATIIWNDSIQGWTTDGPTYIDPTGYSIKIIVLYWKGNFWVQYYCWNSSGAFSCSREYYNAPIINGYTYNCIIQPWDTVSDCACGSCSGDVVGIKLSWGDIGIISSSGNIIGNANANFIGDSYNSSGAGSAAALAKMSGYPPSAKTSTGSATSIAIASAQSQISYLTKGTVSGTAIARAYNNLRSTLGTASGNSTASAVGDFNAECCFNYCTESSLTAACYFNLGNSLGTTLVPGVCPMDSEYFTAGESGYTGTIAWMGPTNTSTVCSSINNFTLFVKCHGGRWYSQASKGGSFIGEGFGSVTNYGTCQYGATSNFYASSFCGVSSTYINVVISCNTQCGLPMFIRASNSCFNILLINNGAYPNGGGGCLGEFVLFEHQDCWSGFIYVGSPTTSCYTYPTNPMGIIIAARDDCGLYKLNLNCYNWPVGTAYASSLTNGGTYTIPITGVPAENYCCPCGTGSITFKLEW